MGTYALNFPIKAGDPAPLRDIAASVQQIAAQTKLSKVELGLFDATFKQNVASGLSFKNALAETTREFAKMGPTARSFVIELRDLVSAQDQAAAAALKEAEAHAKAAAAAAAEAEAVNLLGQAHSHVVPQIAATSAAVRTLEGGSSIRAIEQLLTKTLGLGPAFQAAFPIFGAVAMVEMIGEMIDKIGKLYNAWDPVVKAQEAALKSMKELNAEYNRLTTDVQKRIYDRVEQRDGRAARLRFEANDISGDAKYEDAARIKTIEDKIDKANARIAAGKIVGSAIAPGTRYTNDAQAAKVDLQRLDSELENARLKQQDDVARAADLQGEAHKEDIRKGEEAKRKAEEIARRNEALHDRVDAVLKRPGEENESYQKRAVTEQLSIDKLVRDLRDNAKKLTVAPLDSNGRPIGKADPKEAALELTLAAEVLARGMANIREILREGAAKDAADFERMNDAVLKSVRPPGMKEDKQEEGAKGTLDSFYSDAAEMNLQVRDNLFTDAAAARKQRELQDQINQTNAGADRRISDINSKLAVSTYASGAKISDIQNQAFDSTPVAFKQPGRIQDEARMQMSALKDEFERDAKVAAEISDHFERARREAQLTADYRVQERQIQAKMTEDLQQARQQQAEDIAQQSEKLSSGFSSSLMGMLKGVFVRIPGQHESHATVPEQLGRTLATDLGGKMMQNITQMFLFNPTGTGLLDSLPNLKGTMFGPLFKGTALNRIGASDPASSSVELAQKDNTRETTANTAATQELTRAVQYIASGGSAGSLPGGTTAAAPAGGGSIAGLAAIPGLPTFGSDTNGLTGGPLELGIGATLPPDLAQVGGVGDLARVVVSDAGGTGGGDIAATAGTLSKGLKTISSFASLMTNPFGDKGGTPGVDGQPGTDNGRFSGMGMAAAGADVAIGGITAYQQFSRGGAKGALGGTSAILGTVAMLDPEPISKIALGIAAAATSMIGSILGDPKQMRQRQISGTLFQNQYQAPDAINVTSSTRGGYADLSGAGNIRSSNLSPYPSQLQSYQDWPFRTTIPGVTLSPFGGGAAPAPAPAPQVTVHIAAMDGPSLGQFLKNNHGAVTDAVALGLNAGHTPMTAAVKRVTGAA